MKTYRQREKQGTKVSDSTKGPDEAKIKELLDRTDYTLDVTTGQRKYGGPPPEEVYSGAQPNVGTEVRRVVFLSEEWNRRVFYTFSDVSRTRFWFNSNRFKSNRSATILMIDLLF